MRIPTNSPTQSIHEDYFVQDKMYFTLSRAREIFKLTEEMNEVTFYNVSLSDTFLTPRFCEEK